MRYYIIFTRWLGYFLLGIAFIFIVIGIIGTWMKGGFSAVQELLSPYNIFNFIITALTIAPGALLISYSENLQKKMRNK